VAFAKKLAEQGQPIQGTLAEQYLKTHRGIILDHYPDDVRFHPGIYSKLNGKTFPALLVIARNKSGQIQAVQATYLEASTAQKIDKSIVTLQKQTFGVLRGATVNFQSKKGAPTLIAEGIETGLSLASAIKQVNIRVTLSKSNFKNIDSHTLPERVVFCLDNDGQDIQSDKLIAQSAKRLIDNHKQVSFMFPTCLSSKKQDYNDVLKHAGQAAIQRDFEHRIPYQTFYGLSRDKDSPNLVSHYKSSVNQDSKSFATLSQRINHLSPSPLITDKMIDHFSTKITQNNHQIEIKNLNAYKSLSLSPDHNLPKTIRKIKDIERDI
jgi:hypothetical protein